MVMKEDLRDTQILINLDAIKKNVELIKNFTGPEVAIMAVIKANGYGCGAANIAPTLMDSGVSCLAVATLTEALELKSLYPSYPVFILGYTPDHLLHYIVEKDIIQTVFSLEQVQLLNDIAAEHNKTVKVHIKVDTGFHRLGKEPSPEYTEEICQMYQLKNIEVEGIFSHLALVNDEENEKQFSLFCKFIEELEQRGCCFKYKHIADSIATIDYPRYHMNMVRPGALLYGMRGFHKGYIPVEQALTFVSAVSQLHKVKQGEGVGYDYLWKAEKDSLIATMPFGYADGYPRNLRDKGYVIINGKKAPVIGVICMDQCMVDVTDIPNVDIGTKAIIYGDGSDGSMTIDEAAKLAGTNKNDILCRLSARPPRKYISSK